jgi:hypothetical protein
VRGVSIRYIFLREYIPIPSLAAHKLQCDTDLATRSPVHALVDPHAPRVRSPPPAAALPHLSGNTPLSRYPNPAFHLPSPTFRSSLRHRPVPLRLKPHTRRVCLRACCHQLERCRWRRQDATSFYHSLGYHHHRQPLAVPVISAPR